MKEKRCKVLNFFVAVIIVLGGTFFMLSYMDNVTVFAKDNITASNEEREENENKGSDNKTEERFPASYGRDIVKRRVSKDGKRIVFLTFDDGPSLKNTPKILDVLDKNSIKGTFFLIGKTVDQGGEYAEIVRRMHKEGHAICSHGYTHSGKNLYPNGVVNVDHLLKEIDDTDNAISKALGFDYKCKMFRFPYGEVTRIYKHDRNINKAIDILGEHGITSIDWNSLTEDAVGNKKSKQQLMNNLKKTSKGKDKIVVLLHDSEDREDTANMIQDIINYFRSQGYSFGAFDI
ncbi:MAG: polysaccharide deacetylase family protein [Clostridium cadaveris]|uniref:polysaccharide deacetylase family protein n=1 Tax=Clostridium cadaveris TaxID=1529 RepID=UPI0015B4646A|nr:polysaccharide deacetylase family protein [Clostridium cadaveris]MDY4950397.1 polysaccharide deacetylase family protein [Clostridium cadaveris]NWK12312.1 polysaccharide deacetylase [Clostridium cadaveris]